MSDRPSADAGLAGLPWALRTRRVMPLIVAHSLLDVVAFVGYTALSGRVSWLP